jgi:methylmalonyl-CoA mutase C-terminal domain/subunit
MTIFPRIMQLLREREVDDIVVIAGGVIQEDDIPKLRAIGVREVFDAEASTQDLIAGIERVVAEFGRDRARREAARAR